MRTNCSVEGIVTDKEATAGGKASVTINCDTIEEWWLDRNAIKEELD